MASSFFSSPITSVLISDDVNQRCVDILTNNGLRVVKNTKLTAGELKEQVKHFDALVVRSATKVTREVIESGLASLKLIARAGTGVDNIDVDAASGHGILVMNTLGSNTISATELTCAHICALSRQLTLAAQSMKDGKWERSKFLGSELSGKTLAVIGLGRIGKEVATRMQSFGMRTIGYDPITTASDAAKSSIEFLSLDEIWPQADYITIHVPLLAETKYLIDASVLAKCKRGVKVVNCARGGIVSEEALLEALTSGQCGGAALDCFEQEPSKNMALIGHVNVICTPHLGASTAEAQNRVALDIAEQIVKFAKNQQLIGGVNADKLVKLV